MSAEPDDAAGERRVKYHLGKPFKERFRSCGIESRGFALLGAMAEPSVAGALGWALSNMRNSAPACSRFLAQTAANMMMTDLTSYPARTFRSDHIRPWLPGSDGGEGIGGAQRRGAAIPGLKLDGRRILIVEDEALLALDLQFACEDEGAEVIGPAMSLDQALAKLESRPAIDGAILDVDLCGRDVYPVAAMLRDRDVPFIFHTGHGSRTRLAELFPGSVTCSKPSSPDTLIHALLLLMA